MGKYNSAIGKNKNTPEQGHFKPDKCSGNKETLDAL